MTRFAARKRKNPAMRPGRLSSFGGCSEAFVLRLFLLQLLHPGLKLLQNLGRLRRGVGEHLLGLRVLRVQRELLEAGLRAFERGDAGFHLGGYGHLRITCLA